MLFQIYGDTALWQLLGWALVFTGLVLANEIARRSKAGGIFFFPGASGCTERVLYRHQCGGRKGC